jgi:hypothetical protein
MPRSNKTFFVDPRGLFGDGPPHWIVNTGKPYEHPSQTLVQANKQRLDVINTLRWHGKRNDDNAIISVADKLLACKPATPCLSGACPICMRAQQRWLVLACIHAFSQSDSVE